MRLLIFEVIPLFASSLIKSRHLIIAWLFKGSALIMGKRSKLRDNAAKIGEICDVADANSESQIGTLNRFYLKMYYSEKRLSMPTKL